MARDPVLCEKDLLVDTGGSFFFWFLNARHTSGLRALEVHVEDFRGLSGLGGTGTWGTGSGLFSATCRGETGVGRPVCTRPKKKTSVVSSVRVYGGTSVRNREAFECVFVPSPPTPPPPPSDTLGGVVNRGNVRKAHKQTNRIKMIFLRSLVP